MRFFISVFFYHQTTSFGPILSDSFQFCQILAEIFEFGLVVRFLKVC